MSVRQLPRGSSPRVQAQLLVKTNQLPSWLTLPVGPQHNPRG